MSHLKPLLLQHQRSSVAQRINSLILSGGSARSWALFLIGVLERLPSSPGTTLDGEVGPHSRWPRFPAVLRRLDVGLPVSFLYIHKTPLFYRHQKMSCQNTLLHSGCIPPFLKVLKELDRILLHSKDDNDRHVSVQAILPAKGHIWSLTQTDIGYNLDEIDRRAPQ